MWTSLQKTEQVSVCQSLDPHRGQLEREWKTIEPHTNLGNRAGVLHRRDEVGPDALSAVEEQCHMQSPAGFCPSRRDR